LKVLILGVTGMLGHKLYQVLTPVCDVTGTIRGPYADIAKYDLFEPARIVPDIDVQEISQVERAIEEVSPDVVQSKGTRLIHISTDCVFSGRKGNYREDDPSDAGDIYGKTKYLGEVNEPGALTIRTSFIGRELSNTNGLLEWFLVNKGGRVRGFTDAIFSGFPSLHLAGIISDIITKYQNLGGRVRGFTDAIFSGFPSLHLAGIISDIITKYQNLSGVYHISSEPLSKFELLSLIEKAMGLSIEIEQYPGIKCNRSLDSTRYRDATGFAPLPWGEMVNELAQDAEQYLRWR